MGFLNFLKSFSKPVYDPEEAGKVVHNNLSEDLKKKLTRRDVDLILELEFQYQQKMGLVSDREEPFVMDDRLNQFIIGEAAKKNKNYESGDIDKILEAEEIYLGQIGAIEE